MSVDVRIPTILRAHTGGRSVVFVEGASLQDVITNLDIDYSGIGQRLLDDGAWSRPRRGTDAGDHPPITPMRAAPRDEFSKGNEWKIYDYVTRLALWSDHIIRPLLDHFKGKTT